MQNILAILLAILLAGCSSQADSNDAYPPENYFAGRNLIMGRAIAEEDTDEITRLVEEEGYDPSMRETSPGITRRGGLYENTYLNYAVSAGKIKSATTLLELGADVDALIFVGLRGIGFSNMNMAVRKPDREMIDLLLQYHINLNNPLAASPLHDLLMNEIYDTALYDLLIAHGADVNHPSYISGETPLQTAYNIKNMKMFHYLLGKGANPTQVDLWGHSVASSIQEDIKEHSTPNPSEFLDDILKRKELLANEYGVQFPVRVSTRRGFAERIARYDGLSQENRAMLGEGEQETIEKMRHSLETGVYNGIELD